jgi:hypothetical protein
MPTGSWLCRVRAATVTELCAVWLGILAVLPFTAPFATLDAADFFGGGRRIPTTAVVAAPGAAVAQGDDADDGAACEAVFQRAHPEAFDGLAPIPAPLASPISSAEPVAATGTVAARFPDSSVLEAVLRL